MGGWGGNGGLSDRGRGREKTLGKGGRRNCLRSISSRYVTPPQSQDSPPFTLTSFYFLRVLLSASSSWSFASCVVRRDQYRFCDFCPVLRSTRCTCSTLAKLIGTVLVKEPITVFWDYRIHILRITHLKLHFYVARKYKNILSFFFLFRRVQFFSV